MIRPRRVHLLAEHDVYGNPHGTSHIRLLRVLGLPPVCARFELTASTRLPTTPPDVLVLDRIWRGWGDEVGVRQDLLRLGVGRPGGPRLVYALDDALMDLSQLRLEDGRPYPTSLVWWLIRQAALVVVTTPVLADRIRRWAARVAVVPNGIDAEWIQGPLPPKGPTLGPWTIGYMGTYTHLDDLQLLVPALRLLQIRSPGPWQLEVVGGGDPNRLRALFQGVLPVDPVQPPQGVTYARFMRWWLGRSEWLMGVAPLVDRPFNRAKSDIKWLDYSALGVPTLASAGPVYGGSIQSGVNGLLVPAQAQDWAQALARVVHNPQEARPWVQAARADILASRTLDHAAAQWIELLDVVADPGHQEDLHG